jgi:hypothetical protein
MVEMQQISYHKAQLARKTIEDLRTDEISTIGLKRLESVPRDGGVGEALCSSAC